MDYVNYYYNAFDIERNLYEPGELIEQNRLPIGEYIQYLCMPGKPDELLEYADKTLRNNKTGVTIPCGNNVVDFTGTDTTKDKEWERLNLQFLNYHKALTAFDVLNDLPFVHYISLKSGIGKQKNLKVVDVGGGTGHTLCSFFHFPETIEYFLVDPNLRLVHDMFFRIFPKLTYLKMAHLLSYAEQLPFRSDFADLVISLAAMDHYKDIDKFINESYRILKPDGKLFICNVIDAPIQSKVKEISKVNIFSIKFLEKVTRYLYYRTRKVGKDDHTYHFENTDAIEARLKQSGFKIDEVYVFKRYFYIIAGK